MTYNIYVLMHQHLNTTEQLRTKRNCHVNILGLQVTVTSIFQLDDSLIIFIFLFKKEKNACHYMLLWSIFAYPSLSSHLSS